MEPVRISEATEVVNVNDPRQSWEVVETYKCLHGETAVTLQNKDVEAFHARASASELEHERQGLRGYA